MICAAILPRPRSIAANLSLLSTQTVGKIHVDIHWLFPPLLMSLVRATGRPEIRGHVQGEPRVIRMQMPAEMLQPTNQAAANFEGSASPSFSVVLLDVRPAPGSDGKGEHTQGFPLATPVRFPGTVETAVKNSDRNQPRTQCSLPECAGRGPDRPCTVAAYELAYVQCTFRLKLVARPSSDGCCSAEFEFRRRFSLCTM